MAANKQCRVYLALVDLLKAISFLTAPSVRYCWLCSLPPACPRTCHAGRPYAGGWHPPAAPGPASINSTRGAVQQACSLATFLFILLRSWVVWGCHGAPHYVSLPKQQRQTASGPQGPVGACSWAAEREQRAAVVCCNHRPLLANGLSAGGAVPAGRRGSLLF